MDQLERIFALQRELNDEIVRLRRLEGISSEEWVQKNALALLVELGELLNETNFKWWKNQKTVDTEHVKEELVDILHFYVSLCLKMDMGADELYTRYMAKNQENFNRQYGKSDKLGYTAVEKG